MYFLVHYPGQMVMIGPMVRTWTIHHEAKHKVLRKASLLSNYKNISLCLAKCYHTWCYELATGALSHNPLKCGPARFGNVLNIIKDKPKIFTNV